jgi:hypothetical protein
MYLVCVKILGLVVFLATDPEVSGSILGATRFSENSGPGTGSIQLCEDN